MIMLFICSKKVLLLLFQNCLNVVIMLNLKLILLYYLSHIPSIIVLSHFWWSVPVFSMVHRRQTHGVVSSETPIHLVRFFSHLSVSPLSRRCLMRSAHYWTQNFLWSWGQGNYQTWGTSPPPTTLVSSLRSVSECTGSWIKFPSLCWSQVYLNSQCCCCLPGHRLVQCDQIIRWWCSNLGQWLLQS